MEIFHIINPVNHTRTPEGLERYQGEPYVVAADVYAHPMHVGRAGWTWYTGSAGWMYRVAIEGVLGLRRHGQTFSLDPTIPAMWPGFSMTWSVDGTRYDISVSNPQNQCGSVDWVTLDGSPVDARAIPVLEDRQPHRIEVMLGNASAVAPWSETRFAS